MDPTNRNWRVNDLVEALDERDNKWYKAKIKQINDGFIRIHFMKWSDKYDAWYPRDSHCIRRFFSQQSHRNFNSTASAVQPQPSVSFSQTAVIQTQPSIPRREGRGRAVGSSAHQFRVGERIICKWRDSVEYVADVIRLLDGGDYEVRYLDNVIQRVRASSARRYVEADAKLLFDRERRLQEESVSRSMMWYDPVASKIQSESRERRRLQRERQPMVRQQPVVHQQPVTRQQPVVRQSAPISRTVNQRWERQPGTVSAQRPETSTATASYTFPHTQFRRFEGQRPPFRVRTYPEPEAAVRPRSRRITRSPRRFSDHVLLQPHRGTTGRRDSGNPPHNATSQMRGKRQKLVAHRTKNRRPQFTAEVPVSEPVSTEQLSIDEPEPEPEPEAQEVQQVEEADVSEEVLSDAPTPPATQTDDEDEKEPWTDSNQVTEVPEPPYESSPDHLESIASHESPTLRLPVTIVTEKSSFVADEPSPKRRKVETKEAEEEEKEELNRKVDTMEPNDSSPYIVRCIICRSNDESLSTIQCDICQCWVHMECYNLDPESEPPPFFECMACQQPKRLRKSRLGSWRHSWLTQTCNSIHRLRQPSNQLPDLRIVYRSSLKNLQRCFDLNTFLKKAEAMEHRMREELENLQKEHKKLSESPSPYDGEAMLRIIEKVQKIRQSQEEVKLTLDAVKAKMTASKASGSQKSDKTELFPQSDIRAFLQAVNKQARVLNMLQVFGSVDACSCVW